MRLTLRTLLAYMDNILESPDREDLAQQVESSKFASDLIHRTKDTTHRLRLSAPQPVGAGLGFDPNTVAEYLDNLLPADQVAELERICLESDMHLAEVASCHHILTMVLAQPAEIDPQLRRRAYRVGHTPEGGVSITAADGEVREIRVEGPHQMTQAVASEQAAAASRAYRVDAVESAQVIPEYLRTARGERTRKVSLAIAGLLLVGLAALLWPQRERFLSRQSASGTVRPEVATPDQAKAGTPQPETAGGDAAPTADQVSGQPQVPPPTAAEPAPPATATPPAAAALEPAAAGPDAAASAGEPGGGEVPVDAALPTAPLRSVTEPDSAAGIDAPASPGGEARTAASVAGAERAIPEGAIDSSDRYVPDTGHEEDRRSAGDEPVAGPTDETLSPLAELPTDVGIYWDDRDILLRQSPGSGNWIRVASRTPVEVDDRLLSLPAFHPNVALRAGLGMGLSGATQVVLGQTREAPAGFEKLALSGIPTVRIDFGRAAWVNTSGETTVFGLSINGGDYFVSLEPAATIAAEVRRAFVVGKDPVDDPSPLEAMVYAPQGNVTWYHRGVAVKIAEPAEWSVATPDLLEPRPYLTPLDWLVDEPTDRLEAMASAEIRAAMAPGSPANTALLELQKGTTRKEVKSLVAKSSIYVGEFGPFVATLRDSDQRTAWNDQIETLRNALALSPEAADLIKQTLVRERGGEAAADLLDMLRGYQLADVGTTPQEQQAGVLPKLILFLENDSLDYRVLAAYNLRQITGKNFLQNPAGSPVERRRGVQLWRQRLEDGELQPVGLR